MTRSKGLLTAVRGLLHGSDERRAVTRENETLAKYAGEVSRLERRLREAYVADASNAACEIGGAVEWKWKVRLLSERLKAHSMIVGPSGCGKSRLAVLLLSALLRAGVRAATVLDPKQETVSLCVAAIAVAARKLRGSERRALLESVVLVSLFGADRPLPRLNVLAPVPGLDEETHAFQIALLLTNELDQGVGVRQEAILHRVLECLRRADLPLTVLPTALEAPLLLERLAETCAPAELFRATAARLRRESKERVLGLVSRAERVLRLRATRLALGAPNCIDFEELLSLLALVDLSPPMGASDIGKVMSGLWWLGIAHAIRRRPNGAPRCHLVVDEFPTFLAAGGVSMASGVEDLLRLARSKSVYLTALAQDLASISSVSSSLPEQLRTNVHLWWCFRSLADSHFDFLLPTSGRRPKSRSAAPWEESRGGYLERSAEAQLLRSKLQNLADREAFFADRRTGLPGIWMRTADCVLDARPEEIAEVEEAARRHPMLASVDELERAREAVNARVDRLLNVREESLPDEEKAPTRRARGKLDIG